MRLQSDSNNPQAQTVQSMVKLAMFDFDTDQENSTPMLTAYVGYVGCHLSVPEGLKAGQEEILPASTDTKIL